MFNIKSLYADNFRGFSNTLIPIRNVNFFVGENSTGKTSILNIMSLLSETRFWYSKEMDFKEVGFSTFSDMVSLRSGDKNEFSLGFVSHAHDPKRFPFIESEVHKLDKNNYYACLIRFREHDGAPRISEIHLRASDFSIHIKISPSSIKYKISRGIEDVSLEDFSCSGYHEWISSHCDNNDDFKSLKGSSSIINELPPMHILSFIESEIEDGDRSRNVYTLFHGLFFVGNPLIWLAPIRTKPRKTYDEFRLDFSPEGEHTPYLIKKNFTNSSASKKFKAYIKRIGRESGLFEDIKIKSYGRGASAPFELDVVLNGRALSISNVGYGVSQSLPVIVELFLRESGASFAIQQPEVHLHPKAQASLGEVIFDLAKEDQKSFIVETHSDYLIDRFRILASKRGGAPNSQILFFERSKSGNAVSVIPLSTDGSIASEVPDKYRDFFIQEQFDMLGI